jgi:uncharacterized protein YbjT (DUF2867 family)
VDATVKRVLVAGATGFVGARLCRALRDEGYSLQAMTRRPDQYQGVGTPTYGDVERPESLHPAMDGCDSAYYLVHSLDESDFEEREAAAAHAFATAAAATGLRRIVYLGALGDESERLSRHLRSRRKVEGILASTGVPVTTLRAGIVVGRGGTSWELTHRIVDRLPVLVTPRWANTRTQPIAVDDVVRYLVGVLELPEAASRSLDVGGAEVLTYADMVRRVATIRGRLLPLFPVPALSLLLRPPLSTLWGAFRWISLGLWLVTDLDTTTGVNLIKSMRNEVVMRDYTIRQLVPFEPMDYSQAVLVALNEAAEARAGQLGSSPDAGDRAS